MTDNIIGSTLETAILMDGRKATLQKPSVSMPLKCTSVGKGGY